MSDKGWKIGDDVETDGYGEVEIIDVFISPTTQNRCYKVRTDDNDELYIDATEFNS